MHTLGVVVLLISAASIDAAPLASIHVKFVSPPHSYEHGITTDGGNTVAQKSFLSIGRRNSGAGIARQFGSRNTPLQEVQRFDNGAAPTAHRSLRGRTISPANAEALWPIGVFLPPVDVNDLGYSARDHVTPDFSDGLEHPDPLLLTGDEAMLAVKYIFGRGELFYNDYPHVRALLRNQEERRLNGLQGNLLSSLRPDSPFYRKANNHGH
ncbi:uncharacterized protein LOC105690799 isoform X2 [Athalia rosae]|uniref:uncharacterized protein LOC105690799 isoform X2 n=1 Tax=Athalia rosae TaxID=37344 RepID=UPI00203358D5|nr:uncharacterized protein LOC105690799 isoform X2 [Athalia rosae]